MVGVDRFRDERLEVVDVRVQRDLEQAVVRDTSAASAASATVGALPSSINAIAASTIAWRVRCFWLTRPPPVPDDEGG